MSSGLQESLSNVCCCFDIEFGAFLVGITRMVIHLARIMVGIVLLHGGIAEGVTNSTLVPHVASTSNETNSRALLYSTDRQLMKSDVDKMRDRLKLLAICWLVYYSIYFAISFLYSVGLKLQNWIMMTPMLIMSAVDIFVPPFLQSAGVVFAYMMHDVYKEPAITITFFWEVFVAVFGLYIFAVVWGSWLRIKNKKKKILEG